MKNGILNLFETYGTFNNDLTDTYSLRAVNSVINNIKINHTDFAPIVLIDRSQVLNSLNTNRLDIDNRTTCSLRNLFIRKLVFNRFQSGEEMDNYNIENCNINEIIYQPKRNEQYFGFWYKGRFTSNKINNINDLRIEKERMLIDNNDFDGNVFVIASHTTFCNNIAKNIEIGKIINTILTNNRTLQKIVDNGENTQVNSNVLI